MANYAINDAVVNNAVNAVVNDSVLTQFSVPFGEHWQDGYVPAADQKYWLCYAEGDNRECLPAHCRDAEGKLYKVSYVTTPMMLAASLGVFSKINNCGCRACLVPQDMEFLIPGRLSEPEENSYASYMKEQAKQKKEKQRSEFMKLLENKRCLTPVQLIRMGIPAKLAGITMGKLKVLAENQAIDIPQNIVRNIGLMDRYITQFRWRYMIWRGKKLGIGAMTIGKYIPLPAYMDSLYFENPGSDCGSKGAAGEMKLEGLVLHGSMGTMKTSLAVAFLKAAMEIGISCQMVNMAIFGENYVRGPGATKNRQSLAKVPILLLDSLGRESSRKQVMTIMEQRYDSRLVTVITTNLTPFQLANRYGAELWDRLQEISTVLQFEGKSLRGRL